MERIVIWSVILALVGTLGGLSVWTTRLQIQLDRGLTLKVAPETYLCLKLNRRTFLCRELEPSDGPPKMKKES